LIFNCVFNKILTENIKNKYKKEINMSFPPSFDCRMPPIPSQEASSLQTQKNRSNIDQRKPLEERNIQQHRKVSDGPSSLLTQRFHTGEFSFSEVFEQPSFSPRPGKPYTMAELTPSNYRENIEPADSHVHLNSSSIKTENKKEAYVPPKKEELKASRISELSQKEKMEAKIIDSKLRHSGCVFAMDEHYEEAEQEGVKVKVKIEEKHTMEDEKDRKQVDFHLKNFARANIWEQTQTI
jgi:hypothetical protein